MRILSEEEILNEDIRKRIITEILDQENVDRKRRAFKAYEIFKDQTKKYVIESLSKEMEAETIEEMRSRAANISICKKIVNKKARIYKSTPKRSIQDSVDDKKTQFAVEELYDLVKFNTKAKKLNRFYELRNNTAFQIVPVEDDNGKYYLSVRALPDFLYDVVENAKDPEQPMVYITSPFVDNGSLDSVAYRGNTHNGLSTSSFPDGDGREQLIADSPNDVGKEHLEFIWWSKNYHFTTNEKGTILANKSPENNENPIHRLNFVTAARSQDGQYWARGSDDLVDGSVLINTLLTDLYFIAKIQGMGTFYYFGKEAAKDRKVGPNHGFFVEVNEGDPTPSIGFATSNPPLESHMRMVEQYIALLLSTNDLSANMVAGSLQATTAASGIQDLINKAEVTSAIEDEHEIFREVEQTSFEVIRAWHNLYVGKKLMQDKYQKIGVIDESATLNVKFMPPEEFMTEEQKLNIIEKRLNLGLDDMVDAMIRDNPDMGEDEAKEKLLQMLGRKIEMSRNSLLEANMAVVDNNNMQNAQIEQSADNLQGNVNDGSSRQGNEED